MKFIKDKLSTKLFVLSLIPIIFFILISAFYVLPTLREDIYAVKREQVQELGQVGLSTVAHYHQREQAGDLTRTEAQNAAKEALRSLRFGEELEDYFWVKNFQHEVLMHPFMPELEGENVEDIQDPDGVYLFQEMVETVEDKSEGYVEYQWQYYDEADRMEPKIAYVIEFEPWGWIIGTGIYIDDIAPLVMHRVLTLSGFIGGTIILAVLITRKLSRSMVINPIQNLVQTAQELGRGNLDVRAPNAKTDEIGELSEAFNYMAKDIKRYHNQLQEKIQEHEMLMDNIDIQVWYLADGQTYGEVNHAFARFFGLEKNELEYKNIWKLIPGTEQAKAIVENNKIVFREKKQLKTEEQHKNREGETRILAVTRTPRFNDRGAVECVVCSAVDMTEQKQAEKELERSRTEYQNLVESLNEGVAIADDKENFLYVNSALEKIFGVEPGSLIGKNIKEFLTEASFQKVLTQTQKRKQGFSGSYELEIFQPEGNKRLIEVSASPRFDGYRYIGSFAVFLDVTEKRQTEKIMQARLNIMEFASDNPLEAVLQKAIDEACRITGSTIGFYHFVGEDEKTLTLKAWSSETLGQFCEIGDHNDTQYNVDGARGWVDCIRERRPIIHNDYFSFVYSKGFPKGHARVKRELVVPIFRQGKIVAILGVANKPQNYTEQDVELVNYFADMAWEVAERKINEEYIRYVSFHDTLTDVYNRYYLEEEIKRLDTPRQLPITVIMVDVNGLKLVNDTFGHAVGDEMLQKAADIIKNTCREEDIVARWGGDEFVILLPQTDEDQIERIQNRLKTNSQGVYVRDVPVSIALGSGTKSDSEGNIEKTLKIAEENMYKQKLAESEQVKGAILKTLMRSLQAKSFESEAHTQNMLRMAWKIGEKLELQDTELQRLRLLVTFHDIGMIHIPGDILTKEGFLTEVEWKEIKKHPEIGYRIARATDEYAHVAEDILAHHERWDGLGYPRGLKESDIPLLARITAIVDAYDVMLNGRPYNPAKDQEQIIHELKHCAGTQFDPKLVDIFVALLENDSE